MKLVAVLVVLAVLGVVAAVLVGAIRADMDEPTSSLPPSGVPEGDLVPEDLHAVRFSLGFRGYRMDEVDDVLDRAAAELARRDAEIERLRSGLRHEVRADGRGPDAPQWDERPGDEHRVSEQYGDERAEPGQDGHRADEQDQRVSPVHRSGDPEGQRPAEDQNNSSRPGATAASVAPASGRPDWSAADGTT